MNNIKHRTDRQGYRPGYFAMLVLMAWRCLSCSHPITCTGRSPPCSLYLQTRHCVAASFDCTPYWMLQTQPVLAPPAICLTTGYATSFDPL